MKVGSNKLLFLGVCICISCLVLFFSCYYYTVELSSSNKNKVGRYLQIDFDDDVCRNFIKNDIKILNEFIKSEVFRLYSIKGIIFSGDIFCAENLNSHIMYLNRFTSLLKLLRNRNLYKIYSIKFGKNMNIDNVIDKTKILISMNFDGIVIQPQVGDIFTNEHYLRKNILKIINFLKTKFLLVGLNMTQIMVDDVILNKFNSLCNSASFVILNSSDINFVGYKSFFCKNLIFQHEYDSDNNIDIFANNIFYTEFSRYPTILNHNVIVKKSFLNKDKNHDSKFQQCFISFLTMIDVYKAKNYFNGVVKSAILPSLSKNQPSLKIFHAEISSNLLSSKRKLYMIGNFVDEHAFFNLTKYIGPSTVILYSCDMKNFQKSYFQNLTKRHFTLLPFEVKLVLAENTENP